MFCLVSSVPLFYYILPAVRAFFAAPIPTLLYRKWPMSVHEMTAAMYYLLAQRRGERGSEPNGEHEAHAGNTPVSDDELAFLRR